MYLCVTLFTYVNSCYLHVTRACGHIIIIMYIDSQMLVHYTCVLHASDFYLCVNQKRHVPGCAHMKRVFLLVDIVSASIKFKLRCTVSTHLAI